MTNSEHKLTRRSFIKAGAAAAASASLGLPVNAEEPQEENCFFPKVSATCKTKNGPVKGIEKDGVITWYGIPYGAAPVDELRWHAPVEPAPWLDTLDCTEQSTVAYQYNNSIIGTEDCLKLDVYSRKDSSGLPVLVYLHGGNNQTGSTQELPGKELIKTLDCVFVSVDYRLGLFGFNCLPALHSGEDDSGNFALLDMALALNWVQDNISVFGGDPKNVTVSGFSAGGRDVMTMLTSSVFTDLFHKAISFSGGMTIANEAASERQIAAAFAPLAVKAGKCKTEDAAIEWLLKDDEEVSTWLYSLDSADIVPLMKNANIRMSGFPHLYGDGVTLPSKGFNVKNFNNVPLMLVTGTTEFSMFSNWDSWFSGKEAQKYTTAQLSAAKTFATRYGSEMFRIFNGQCSAEKLSENYTSPVYICQIEYGSSSSRTQIPTLGSFHGIFMPMLSSTNSYTSYADFTTSGYKNMGEKFRRYLKRFLISGSPNSNTDWTEDLPWNTVPDWPRWRPANKVSMVLDASKNTAYAEAKDVSASYEEIFAKMDADLTIPTKLKTAVIQNVLNGRWFSDELDEHYNCESLWK